MPIDEPPDDWPPAERGVAHLRVTEGADDEPLGRIVPPQVVVEHSEPYSDDEQD
jgi:hypothetical protein